MTKQELLKIMRRLGACEEATLYVTDHASDDAKQIWRECERVDWLIWFAGRTDTYFIAAFAKACADRAKTYAAAAVVALPSSPAAAHAARSAANAARAAAYAADAAAAARAAYAAGRLSDLAAAGPPPPPPSPVAAAAANAANAADAAAANAADAAYAAANAAELAAAYIFAERAECATQLEYLHAFSPPGGEYGKPFSKHLDW